MHAQGQATYNKCISNGILSFVLKNIYKYMHKYMQHTRTQKCTCLLQRNILSCDTFQTYYISVLTSNGLISLYTSKSLKSLCSSSVTTSPAVLYQFQYHGLKAGFISSTSMDSTRHL